MIKYPIILYCCISFSCFALHRLFLPAKIRYVSHTSKQWGTIGKHRELERKGNTFLRLTFASFCPFSFTACLVQRYGSTYPIQSVFVQVAVCGTFDGDKHYDPISFCRCFIYQCRIPQMCAKGTLPYLSVPIGSFPSFGLNHSLQPYPCKISVRTLWRMNATLCKHSPNAWNFSALFITSLSETQTGI